MTLLLAHLKKRPNDRMINKQWTENIKASIRGLF
jgi:hypothetical protein